MCEADSQRGSVRSHTWHFLCLGTELSRWGQAFSLGEFLPHKMVRRKSVTDYWLNP